MRERTAKAIREALQGQGRVYLRRPGAPHLLRVTDARTRRGGVQVRMPDIPGVNAWETLQAGAELKETP